ncbi:MAG: hypothetical protein Kow0090_01420 [Myxococcota bacterium]
MIVGIYITITLIFALLVFVRLIGTAAMGNALLRQRKLRRFVDIDRILAARADTPVSILLPLDRFSEKIGENIDRLLKLNARKYELIILFAGSGAELDALVGRYNLTKRFHVVKRELGAPKEKEVYFSAEESRLALVLFEEGTKTDALLNAGVNISTYPNILVVRGSYLLATNGLLALFRPINILQGECEAVSAPVYLSVEAKAPLYADVWRLFIRALFPNVVLPQTVYLFNKRAAIEEGGFFAEPIWESESSLARKLKSRRTERQGNLNDIVAVYNGEKNISLFETAGVKLSTFWEIALRKRISYSRGYTQLVAFSMLARGVICPLLPIGLLYGLFSPYLFDAVKPLAVLIMSDMLLELAAFSMTAMLNQTARERILQTLFAGAVAFLLSFVEIFLLFRERKR